MTSCLKRCVKTIKDLHKPFGGNNIKRNNCRPNWLHGDEEHHHLVEVMASTKVVDFVVGKEKPSINGSKEMESIAGFSKYNLLVSLPGIPHGGMQLLDLKDLMKKGRESVAFEILSCERQLGPLEDPLALDDPFASEFVDKGLTGIKKGKEGKLPNPALQFWAHEFLTSIGNALGSFISVPLKLLEGISQPILVCLLMWMSIWSA